MESKTARRARLHLARPGVSRTQAECTSRAVPPQGIDRPVLSPVTVRAIAPAVAVGHAGLKGCEVSVPPMGVSVWLCGCDPGVSLAAAEKQARGSEFPPGKALEELAMGRKEPWVSMDGEVSRQLFQARVGVLGTLPPTAPAPRSSSSHSFSLFSKRILLSMSRHAPLP